MPKKLSVESRHVFRGIYGGGGKIQFRGVSVSKSLFFGHFLSKLSLNHATAHYIYVQLLYPYPCFYFQKIQNRLFYSLLFLHFLFFIKARYFGVFFPVCTGIVALILLTREIGLAHTTNSEKRSNVPKPHNCSSDTPPVFPA